MPETKNTVQVDESTTSQLSPIWIISIIIVVVILLVGTLAIAIARHQLVKNQEKNAQAVAGKVIADMGKQDTAAILKLSDASFQKKYTATQLNDKLTFDYNNTKLTFADVYGDAKPQVNRSIVANNSAGQHTSFIYVYTKLKVPFYVRLDLTKTPGSDQWKLNALSASSTESNLE